MGVAQNERSWHARSAWRPQQAAQHVTGMPGAQVESWGYEAIPVSAASGGGLAMLANALAGRVSVLAGPSGVGKSSLINALTMRAAGAPSVTHGLCRAMCWCCSKECSVCFS